MGSSGMDLNRNRVWKLRYANKRTVCCDLWRWDERMDARTDVNADKDYGDKRWKACNVYSTNAEQYNWW